MSTKLFTLLAFCVFVGCSALRLPQWYNAESSAQESNWIMWGGNPERTNVGDELFPPLTLLWEYDLAAGVSPQCIVAADSLLFIGDLKGEVHALDIMSGKKYGSLDFGSAIVGSPLVHKQYLYVALAQEEISVIAYNLHTGRVAWRASVGAVETSPLLVQGKLCVVTIAGLLVCMESETGKNLWTFTVSNNTMVHSSPASNGTVIIFGCDDGLIYCVGLSDGTMRWRFQTQSSVMAPPAIENHYVYVASLDGVLYALDLTTGNEVWRNNLGGKIYGSIAVNENYIYVGTANRMVHCVDKNNGDIRWSFFADGAVSGGLLIAGTVLYFGSLGKTFYAIDANDGTLLWKYETNTRIRSTPLVHRGVLVVPLEDRKVLAMTLTKNRNE